MKKSSQNLYKNVLKSTQQINLIAGSLKDRNIVTKPPRDLNNKLKVSSTKLNVQIRSFESFGCLSTVIAFMVKISLDLFGKQILQTLNGGRYLCLLDCGLLKSRFFCFHALYNKCSVQ